MPKEKRMRMSKQDEKQTEAEAEVETDEPEVPNEVADEDPVEEQNNEAEDAEDVVEEVPEGEEEAQGADVERRTSRRRNRKRRLNFNGGKPASTPNSSQREKKEVKIAGMIFMCNDETKKDCFKYGVFGLPEEKKDLVEQVKRGMKLFLFDINKKHLYGIYEASSRGGMNLAPEAFRESDRKFPAQVRFRIHKDCIPLNESDFKEAITDNYVRRGRFRTELSSEQVRSLIRLFRPLDSEGVPQPRNTRDARRQPAPRDARRGPSRESHARGSARHVSRPAPPEPIRHFPRPAPPEPVREPLYTREVASLYARERPPIDLDYYHTQPGYISAASQIARAEAEGRRRYLDNLYLEQTNLIARRPPLHDPLYRGAEYQREMMPPYSSYMGSRSSGLPY